MPNNDLLSRRAGFKRSWSIKGFLALLLVLVLISNANAACSVSGGCGSNSGDWESSANAFLSSDVPGSFISSDALKTNVIRDASKENAINNTTFSSNIESKATANYVSLAARSDEFVNGSILEPLLGVSSSDVVIDVSNGNNYSEQPHIKGSIHIPSKSFLYENGTLRPASELAAVLGNAGISRDDSVVLYGESMISSDATFVFWVMRYLGHEDAKVLDGGLDSWIAASLPLESGTDTRKPAEYEPKIRQELLVNYNYVSSGRTQLVDARTFQDFGKKRIPGSISIDSARVLENSRIKDAAKLNDTFTSLEKDKPIVVYSEDELNASLVWYALQLMGYDSRLYTWKDWLAHQSAEDPKVNAIKAGILGVSAIDTSKYKKLG